MNKETSKSYIAREIIKKIINNNEKKSTFYLSDKSTSSLEIITIKHESNLNLKTKIFKSIIKTVYIAFNTLGIKITSFRYQNSVIYCKHILFENISQLKGGNKINNNKYVFLLPLSFRKP